MPGSDIDLRGNILSLFNLNLVGKSLVLAHKKAPQELKREIVGLLVNKGLVSLCIGDRKGKTAYSRFIRDWGINEFFRTCHLFRNKIRDIPTEFTIGRTHPGTPIILCLNKEFMNRGLWYDEAASSFFYTKNQFAFLYLWYIIRV